MDKIKWCCKQKNGIELIEPRENLNKSYLKESEDDLKEIQKVGNKWKTIIAYYSCYESLYSLLMKVGIKSEIHDCTIELMNLFGFDKEDKYLLKNLKSIRQGNQYYLKKNPLEQEKQVKDFIMKCKEKSLELNTEKIEKIRQQIQEMIKDE
ncbi:MAG: hypothetical protein ACOCUU_02080 [Nanoarchaeota archaeon]